MKKLLIPLVVLAMLCACLPVLGEEAVTLEIANLAKLPVYESSDPQLEAIAGKQDDGMSVLVLPAKKTVQLQARTKSGNGKTGKAVLSSENPEIVRVKGNRITGQKTGQTVLTIASEQHPEVALSYRVVVIQPVTRLSISADAKSVAAGQTISLTAQYVPENATVKQAVWSSSDERIATVDANGRVTGVAKGSVRIMASALDGSGVRANIRLQVMQNAEGIGLDKNDITVDVGRTAVLKATVLPVNANDRNVVWSSSNESIAKVSQNGRITGVALGECEIVCTSKTNSSASARAAVHVQQPVKSIVFDDVPYVYVNESASLTWHVEPADASNTAVTLTSGNPGIATVSEDGTITGVSAGETYISAMSADGSNRRARVKVRVGQHVEGVQMKRNAAYIDVGGTSVTGAVLSPKNANNKNMSWTSADPAIAQVKPVNKEPWRVSITGVSAGQTVVTGTTEDGGLQATMTVNVGNYEQALELDSKHTFVEGADIVLRVNNVSNLNITGIKAEVTVRDIDGNPVPCNSADDSATFTVVYKMPLAPGESTRDNLWKYVNFKLPDSLTVAEYEVRITEFTIDNDWVKVIRKKYQPTKKCPVHL